ncbi:nidogen-like domain-containing protein [Ditylenchus destructor]|uniref:Nidogen-like domain-containing protein n=1 Tax=Ditylenchus destructor TaxID=166010 RepID=A0AAD4MMI2_9BILA|nr:nidogen-like domain-containing protein [Ditylenchus destructor]
MATARLLLLYIVTTAWLSFALAIVPLKHFFPHGTSMRDKKLERGDDTSSEEFQLKMPFHFFGQAYHSLWVNVNGAISFASPIATFTPECGPVNREFSAIGPYWADVDIRETGNIYYRQSKRKSDLKKARREIEDAFPDIERLKLKWALIVTCDDSMPRNFEDFDKKRCHECNNRKRNTFQLVITTDGKRSYAIFYYNKLEWTTGEASGGELGLGGIPARAGFDLGDGKHYTMIPGSCNGDVLKINHKSNVGSPGKWIFRVDEANIRSAGCSKQNESGEQVLKACKPAKKKLKKKLKKVLKKIVKKQKKVAKKIKKILKKQEEPKMESTTTEATATTAAEVQRMSIDQLIPKNWWIKKKTK